VRPEPQDEDDRHRYVFNAGCQVCHDRHETTFSTTGDGDDTPRLLAELIEKTFEVRFATSAELVQYHAEKE
jgi:cytochrome c5